MDVAFDDDFSPSRKAKGFALTSAVVSTATAGTYWRVRKINPYQPVLERIALALPGAHAGLDGLTIGFITDIHAGPFMTREAIDLGANLLIDARPDLILFGGDFVSESPRHLEKALPAIERLVAAAPLGGFAVLGNHDIFVSARRVTAELETAGVPVLRNAVRSISWNGATLWIAGIDDTLHGRPDVDAAFAQIPADAATLVLWHEAEFAEAAAERGALAQISGHSHGGQVRFPGLRPLWLPKHGRRHISGMNDDAGMPVYTSRGMGVYRPPVRFNCPPEVTLITLSAASETNDVR